MSLARWGSASPRFRLRCGTIQGISEKRRFQVRETAERLGYCVNQAATMLARFRRASTIQPVHAALAWINAWPNPKALRRWQDFDLYWKGATLAAQKFGYRLEEFLLNKSISPRRLEEILVTRNIRGVLIPPHGNIFSPGSLINWEMFDWKKFSVVRFGNTVNLSVHSVTSDQTGNGMIAFNKIYERGYRRIAFVGRANQARFFGAGFLWAQSQMPEKLRLPMFLIPERPGRSAIIEPQVRERLRSWLKKSRPDAIFHDVADLPRILNEEGYRVPGDIGLASTTVLEPGEQGIDGAGLDQNSEEIGRVAVLVVLSQINDNARGLPAIPRKILVQGRWVDGATLPQR